LAIDTTVEFFISHSHLDKRLAGQIRKLVETKGFVAFLAHEDITPSEDWEEAIKMHLDSCTALIAVVTKDFNASPYTNQEVGFVLAAGKPIIPIAVGVSGENLPGFLKHKQAVFCKNNQLAECVNKTLEPYSSEQLPESVVSRISLGLVIFSSLSLLGLCWAIVWIFTGVQFSPLGTLIGLVLGAAIAFEKGIKGSWDTMRAVYWVRPKIPKLLLASFCFIPAAFGLALSLGSYPMLSGLTFESYSANAPLVATETFAILAIGAFFFNHPTNALREMRWGILSSIRRYGKSWKVYTAAVILLVLSIYIVPIDSRLVLFTPKVALVETRYLTDGEYHVYQVGLTFKAWSQNEKIVHILIPTFPLITQCSYSFVANSTTHTQPSILSSSNLTLPSGTPTEDSQGNIVVNIGTDSTSSPNTQFTVQFYNDYNINSLAYVHLLDHPIFIRNFNNGTQQLEQKLVIVNYSPYNLALDPSEPITVYADGSVPWPANLIFKYSPTPTSYPWPEYSYNNYTQSFLVYGGIQPYANLTVSVVYNTA
jgi:hypothetical protein